VCSILTMDHLSSLDTRTVLRDCDWEFSHFHDILPVGAASSVDVSQDLHASEIVYSDHEKHVHNLGHFLLKNRVAAFLPQLPLGCVWKIVGGVWFSPQSITFLAVILPCINCGRWSTKCQSTENGCIRREYSVVSKMPIYGNLGRCRWDRVTVSIGGIVY
jgi:hypothetical protein